MFLLKCSCGCFFTLKSSTDRWGTTKKCPNCGNSTAWYSTLELDELDRAVKDSGMTLQIIPDDAKVTVTFEP